jgi:hypothetical protein
MVGRPWASVLTAEYTLPTAGVPTTKVNVTKSGLAGVRYVGAPTLTLVDSLVDPRGLHSAINTNKYMGSLMCDELWADARGCPS